MINEESKTILNNEFDVSLEYKGEQSMDRGSSVPHKQWGTIPEGLGARVSFTEIRRARWATRSGISLGGGQVLLSRVRRT